MGDVSFYCSSQDITEKGKATDAQEGASPPTDSSESCEDILFNPNVFTEFKLAGSEEVFFGHFNFLLCFSLSLNLYKLFVFLPVSRRLQQTKEM